jgi:hypothetical protein
MTTDKNGAYTRFVFRFDREYKSYDIRKVENVTLSAINFVTLDKGVVVCLNEEENMEAFSSQKDAQGIKVIEDPILGGDMKLHRIGDTVYFSRGERLFTLKMA